MSMLFDPAKLPPRDKDGYTFHPDLDERFHRDDMDEYLDGDKFRAAGLEIAFIEFEYDATGALQEHWEETGEADCSSWTPSIPKGDGWRLAAVYDAEDGPVALYVRDIPQGAAA